MIQYQDGVEVFVCIGYCKADPEKHMIMDLEDCPEGSEMCSGDCWYYDEDLEEQK